MSGDALCVGICMMDWDQGICLGCGRSQEEIDGSADAAADAEAAGTEATPAPSPPPAENKDGQ